MNILHINCAINKATNNKQKLTYISTFSAIQTNEYKYFVMEKRCLHTKLWDYTQIGQKNPFYAHTKNAIPLKYELFSKPVINWGFYLQFVLRRNKTSSLATVSSKIKNEKA